MPVASGSIAFLGAARFQGYWDATSNNATGSGADGAPTGAVVGLFATGSSTAGGYSLVASQNLTASVGHYWQVTGSGTHNVDGNTAWNLNDWCVYSGSAGGSGTWIRLAFEDTIASIIVGDMSSLSTFHMGGDADKDVIFTSGSVLSGTKNFTFDYDNNNLSLTGALYLNQTNGVYLDADADSRLYASSDDVVVMQIGGEAQVGFYDGAVTALASDVQLGTVANSFNGLFLSDDIQITGNIKISDDKKIYLGSDHDAIIEYNEDGDNLLIISGSSQGIVLSGSTVTVDGNLDVESLVRRAGGSEERIQFADSGMFFYAADSIFLRAAVTDTLSGSVQINNSQNDVDFSHRVNSFVGSLPSLQVSASDGIIHSNYGVTLHDDQKLTLGSASDAHIEYNEDGDNLLIVSGSSQGIVLSGSTVTVDGETTLTGDLTVQGGDIVGPENANFTIASDRSLSLKLDKDNTGALQHFYVLNGAGQYVFNVRNTGEIRVGEDAKLGFGTSSDEDAHILFRDTGDDLLVVSGSSQGMVLSGSNVSVDGAFFLKSIASGSLSGPGSYVGVNDAGQLVLTASSGGTGTVTISNDGDNRLVTAAGDGSVNGEANLTFDGSDLFVTGNINLADDKKIHLGAAGDAHIEFNENGDNLLIISGSGQGMVLSGSTITLDGTVAGPGVASGSISGPGSFLALNDSGQFVLGTPTGGSVTIANDADNRITTAKGDGTLNAEANLVFNGSTLSVSGSVSVSGSLEPNGDAVYNLGSPTHRWANVYTGDLHLRNDRGDWTIVEEEDYLTIINNKKGKRYKFVLEELD